MLYCYILKKKRRKMIQRSKIKFHGLKVLIADDCESNGEILAELLQMMGVESDIAKDGIEALEMATKTAYDMILMDIVMPNIDGIAATQELKNSQKEVPPIVAITANDQEEERNRCLQAGMVDYIIKPVTLITLENLFKIYFKNKMQLI